MRTFTRKIQNDIEASHSAQISSFILKNIDKELAYRIQATPEDLAAISRVLHSMCRYCLDELPDVFLNTETFIPEIPLRQDQIEAIIGGLEPIPDTGLNFAGNEIYQGLKKLLGVEEP